MVKKILVSIALVISVYPFLHIFLVLSLILGIEYESILLKILSLLFIYSYYFFIDYYTTLKYQKNPIMWVGDEILVDLDGFDLTKQQLILRAYTKLNIIILSPYIMYTNKTRDIFQDAQTGRFVWDITAETRVLTMEEYRYAPTEKQRLLNENLDKVIEKKDRELEEIFSPFVQAQSVTDNEEIEKEILKATQDYYAERKNVNVITDEDLKIIQQGLSDNDKNDLKIAKQQIIESEKNNALVLQEQLQKQYKTQLEKSLNNK